MEKHNGIRDKALSQIRQSSDDATALQIRALPKTRSELVTPGNFPIHNKGKSPPNRSRSPGSSDDLNRIGNPVDWKGNRSLNEIEFYQINQKQYQVIITI